MKQYTKEEVVELIRDNLIRKKRYYFECPECPGYSKEQPLELWCGVFHSREGESYVCVYTEKTRPRNTVPFFLWKANSPDAKPDLESLKRVVEREWEYHLFQLTRNSPGPEGPAPKS